MSSLGERIKSRRKELGLTQKELGAKILLTEFNISKYERDYSKPDIDTLSKLSEALDCSVDYLVGKIDNPNSNSYQHNDIILEISKEYPYELTPDEVKELVTLLKDYRFDVDALIKDIKNNKITKKI